MQNFIKEAFEKTTGPYAKAYKSHVKHGKYDIIDHSDNEVILPSQWESTIAPGMNLRMIIYSVDSLDIQVPHGISYYDTYYTYPQAGKLPKPSRNPGAPSRAYQGYTENNSENGGEYNKKEKDSNDDETTPTASPALYRNEKPPSPTDRSPRHGRYLSLPEKSSLPNFEELGIGSVPSQKPTARYPYSEYAKVSTSYADSTYGGMGSVGTYYPHSNSSYVDQPGVSCPPIKGPVSHTPGPFQWPVMNPPPSSKPAEQPLDSDVDRRLTKLELLILDQKAQRKAREAAAQKAERKVQALAIKQAREAERAGSELERGMVMADKTETEMRQAALEADKAQAGIEDSDGTTMVAEPKPVELNDAFGNFHKFPYKECSTWEVNIDAEFCALENAKFVLAYG